MKQLTPKINYPAPIVIEFIRYFGLFFSKILWRIRYHGTENIPLDLSKGLLVVANHQTYFDPFWLCFPIRRKFRFMAWDKACEWFLIGKIIRYLGAFPVSINRRGTVKAMQNALESLQDGATLIVFPEGSRCFSDGKLLDFKTGAVRLAIEANVPILPVTIRGANKVWSQDNKFPGFGGVEIFYHPIIEIPTANDKADDHKLAANLTSQIKNIIASNI